MPTLKITNVGSYTGEYEFDWAFTTREHHEIKQISGLRPTEYLDALMNGDAGFRVAVAATVLGRAGKTVDVETLWEAELKQLWIKLDEESDPDPPAEASLSSESSSGAPDDENEISGNGSSESSASPATSPNDSTSHGSLTGSASVPATSET